MSHLPLAEERAQRVYPIPWTFQLPEPTRRTCLTAFRTDLNGPELGRPYLEINGIVGPPARLFSVAKG